MKCLLDGPSSLKTIHAKQYSTVQTLGTRWVQCSHFGEAEVVNPDSDTDGLHSIIVQLLNSVEFECYTPKTPDVKWWANIF